MQTHSYACLREGGGVYTMGGACMGQVYWSSGKSLHTSLAITGYYRGACVGIGCWLVSHDLSWINGPIGSTLKKNHAVMLLGIYYFPLILPCSNNGAYS